MPTVDGVLDATRRIDVDSGFVVMIEMTRTVDLRVEMFLTGVMSFSNGATLRNEHSRVEIGSLDPIGFRAGLSFRIWKNYADEKRRGRSLYLSPFVGGYVRDRSAIAGSTAAVSTAEGYSIGVGGSFRQALSDQWSFDVATTWERSRLLVNDQGKVSWNPLTVSAGLIMLLK